VKSPEFTVGTHCCSKGKPLVIAEIGTGHGGDPVKAAELIHAAKAAGADCVKFQHVYADEIIHPRTGFVPLPGGMTPLYDRFRSLETGPEFFAGLLELAESLGLLFLCTPFGLRSARELAAIGVKAYKVASPELNHLELLDEIVRTGRPTILSSGVSTLADIERAVHRFRNSDGKGYRCPLALLHCVTSYPAPEEEYNLRVLSPLSRLFGIACGVSDHSKDPVLVPALAVYSGASIVEKHICLSRSDPGLDDPIALPPEDFSRMVQAIREAAKSDPEEALAALNREYGPKRVEAVLGDGRKRLAPSEEANYGRTNRSLHAARPVSQGEPFTRKNLAVLRTEKVLRPGLAPEYLELALSRVARRDVPDGEGIEWGDIG
jgi:sialic acid synthase SpsE